MSVTPSRITMTRALTELKTIGARINDSIVNGVFVALVKGKTQKPANPAYRTIDDLNTTMQASFDTFEGLLNRQRLLKAAVIQSNSVTKVKIGGVEMTVAQAIDQKAIAVYKKTFLSQLKTQMQRATNEYTVAQNLLDAKIEATLNGIYTNGKEKPTQEQYDNIVQPLRDDHAPMIVSGKKDLSDFVRKYEASLAEFISECDFALSEINSVTFIEL